MIRLPSRELRLLVALHGWSGAALGLLLYAVIVTGTAAIFANEIKAWSGGQLGVAEPLAGPVTALADRLAAEVAPEFRDDLSVRATPSGRLQFYYHTDEIVDGERKTRGVLYRLDPDGRITAREQGWGADIIAAEPETALGNFLVELHVRLHIPKPYGLVLTGVLGLAMLVAAVSGLLMHRHLITDLFTLRGRGRPVGWRDLHTVAATWTLPHAFVLSFTGAFFSFAISVGLPMLAKVAFAGDMPAMIDALVGGKQPADPRPVAGTDLDHILVDARARAGAPVASMLVEHRGRTDARVTVRHEPADGALSGVTLVYDGATGAFLAEKPVLGTKPSLGGALFDLMGPLHFGTFAGWASKAVWFALGCASAYVTWSGLSLWVRRRQENPGWRALGRATGWVGAGLPLALACAAAGFFLALPAGATVFWTPTAFLLAANLALVPALWLQAERVASSLFGLTGAVLVALPLLRLTSGGPGWSAALAAGQAAVPVLDILVVLGGLACLVPTLTGRLRARPLPALAQPAE